ncbi:MAG: phosphate transport system regulatory protein PhoU [Gammaproteobacteria bacterium]|nr:MAG: phosphate transport system regulatory protein PhoU [Gammaproteobacteria bacterium]
MSLHLERDLELLKKNIVQLGARVEAVVNRAIRALLDRRADLVEGIFIEERLINQKEVQIEAQCLSLIALHQPVAVDLRLIVAVIKINNDLERMADFANNIANRVLFLSQSPPIDFPSSFTGSMLKNTRAMVHDSLQSFVTLDALLARKVIVMDQVVDEVNRQMYVDLQALMKVDAASVESAVSLLSISRYLERIADLSTNIAEHVLFMIDGDVVRHQSAITSVQ